MKKTIALLLTLLAVLCIGGCAKKDERPKLFSDPTYYRILYQRELDLNADQPRYTSTVMTYGGVLIGLRQHSIYYTMEEFYKLPIEHCYTVQTAHLLALTNRIPFVEEDGTVNDYYVHSHTDNDLAQYFALHCDKPGITTVITWHYDTRGLRVIDEYDVSLAEEKYVNFWVGINQTQGVVPYVWEIDLGIEGVHSAYLEGEGDAHSAKMKELFPDIAPYGKDYPETVQEK